MYAIPQSFVSCTIFDFVQYVVYIIQRHYSQVLRALESESSCYLIEEGMVPDIIHDCDISIIFTLLNVFSSSVFLHWC
jgi:hypothetical protein